MGQMLGTHPLVELIDQAVELAAQAEPPFRNHLGGSMIGRKCEREIWYGFRWAKRPSFQGRMLRLFERGHLEEFRFVKYLKMAGFELRAYSQRLCFHQESDSYLTLDWDDVSTDDVLMTHLDVTDDPAHVERADDMGVRLKQWRISDVRKHFGGSLDGIAQLLPGVKIPLIPEGEGLTEFKTHNKKSFLNLITYKVKEAKPEHWSQMQVYMHKRGLRWGLYLAVCKDDDALHAEVVYADPVVGAELLEKATRIIDAPQPPNRLPGARHPSWHECKFCDFKGICHYGEPMERHCRSCVNLVPVEDGEWMCKHWQSIVPGEFILKGCDNYKMITD